jgi:hypothetical protein
VLLALFRGSFVVFHLADSSASHAIVMTYNRVSKNRPENDRFWQKNRSVGQNISHFFLCFCAFLRFQQLQAVALQRQGRIKPFQKKSYLKTYRRFFATYAKMPGVNEKSQASQSDGLNGLFRIKRRCIYPALFVPFRPIKTLA